MRALESQTSRIPNFETLRDHAVHTSLARIVCYRLFEKDIKSRAHHATLTHACERNTTSTRKCRTAITPFIPLMWSSAHGHSTSRKGIHSLSLDVGKQSTPPPHRPMHYSPVLYKIPPNCGHDFTHQYAHRRQLSLSRASSPLPSTLNLIMVCETTSSKTAKHTCTECGRAYLRKQDLKRHAKLHSPNIDDL